MKEVNTNTNEKELFKMFNIKNNQIIEYGDKMLQDETDIISTGCLQLDEALGVGGIPRGKIIEIYGNESSGKTTIALQTIKQAQALGLKCLYLDLENTLNINYMKSIGIDIEKILIANPMSGEQTFEIIEAMLKNKQVDLIVVDSVAAMLPEVERENDFDSQSIGAHARLMSRGLRKITPLVAANRSVVMFINQIREKIGVMFGNPETTTGGKALKFFASVRLEIKKVELIKSGLEKIGIKSKITVVKNKVAAPLKTAFIDILFNQGYDEMNDILDFAIKYEIIQKSGSWYSYNGEKIGQGVDQLRKTFSDNNELYTEVKNLVLSKIKS